MSLQGQNAPATGADDAGVGTIAWSNPTFIQAGANNASGARWAGTISTSKTSHYLFATGFGFNIPADAVITGVFVEYIKNKLDSAATSITDNVVSLLKAGAVSGSNYAKATGWIQGAAAGAEAGITSYGGYFDMWGLALTPSDINASNFGVAMSCIIVSSSEATPTAIVHTVLITIAYNLNGVAYIQKTRIKPAPFKPGMAR